MRKLFLIATMAVTGLCASQSHAQETNRGFMPYAGIYGGYNSTSDDAVDLDGGDFGGFAGFKLDSLFSMPISAAFEIQYGLSTSEGDATNSTLEKTSEFGISFRPGLTYMPDNSPFYLNPYAILGYKIANYEETLSTGLSIEDSLHGFELGIGAEFLAYDNWVLRGEYSHTFYGKEGNFDPSEDTFRLGLAYKF